MIRLVVSCCTLIVALLGIPFYGNESFLREIEADCVDGNIGNILLSGKVKIKHSIGVLCCDSAKIDLRDNSEKERLGVKKILLKGKVHVELVNGELLRSDWAEIDFDQKKGFFSATENALVILEANIQDAENNKIPLKALAKNMRIEMKQEDLPVGSSLFVVQGIFGEDNVFLDYNHRLFASSDRLTYYCPKTPSYEFSISPVDSFHKGRIFLYSKAEGKKCCLMDNQGSCIESPIIRVALVERKLVCDYPDGVLFAEGSQKGNALPIQLKSDLLIWDEWSNELSMRGNTSVIEPTLGRILNENEVRINLRQEKGRHLNLGWLVAQGKTVLVGVDPHTQSEHEITCQESLFIDHYKGTALFSSPSGIDNKIACEDQIRFKDNYGQFLADQIIMEYPSVQASINEENKERVLKTTIIGNVFMFNNNLVDKSKTAQGVQAAVADQVVLWPQTQEALFTANVPKKVLFFDQNKQLKVSAIKMWFKRNDSVVKAKESIRTEGNVKFLFSSQEWNFFAAKLAYFMPQEEIKESKP